LRISSSPAGGTGALGFCLSFTLSDPARQNGGGLVGVCFRIGGSPFTAQTHKKPLA